MKVIVEGEGEWEFPDDATDGEIAVAINREQGLGPRGVPEFAGRPAGFEPKTRGPLLAALPAQAPRPVPGLEATGFGAEAAPQNPFMNQPVGPPAGVPPLGGSLPAESPSPAGGAALPPQVNPLREAMLARRQAAGGAPLASLGPQAVQAAGAAAQPIPTNQPLPGLAPVTRPVTAFGAEAARATPGAVAGLARFLPEMQDQLRRGGMDLVADATGMTPEQRQAAQIASQATLETVAKILPGLAPGGMARAGRALDDKVVAPVEQFLGQLGPAKRVAEKRETLTTGQKLRDPEMWGATMGAAAPSLAAIAVAQALGVPLLPVTAAMEGGGALRQIEAHEAETGEEVNPFRKVGAAALVAIVNGTLEKFGFERGILKLSSLLPKASRSGFRRAAAQAAQGMGGEGGTETAQEFTSNAVTKLLIDPEQPLAENLVEAGMGGAGAGLLMGGGRGVGVVSRGERIAKARAAREAWEADNRPAPPMPGAPAPAAPAGADAEIERWKAQGEALDARLQGLREPGATRAPEAAALDPEGRRVIPPATVDAINEGVRALVPGEAPRPGLLDDVLSRTTQPNALGEVLGATQARDSAAEAAGQRFRAEADSAERQRIAETPGAALRLILGDDPVFQPRPPAQAQEPWQNQERRVGPTPLLDWIDSRGQEIDEDRRSLPPEEWSHDEARYFALTDGRTGLPNAQAYEIATRQAPNALHAVMDLDGLKGINDTFGHEVGNEYLEMMGLVGRANGVRMFRYGGDEFTVIHDGDEASLRTMIETFRTALEKTPVVGAKRGGAYPTHGGFSYGVGRSFKEGDAGAYADKSARRARRAAGASGTGDAQSVGVGRGAGTEAAPGPGNPAAVPAPVRGSSGDEPGGDSGAPPAGPASLPPPVAPAAAAAPREAAPASSPARPSLTPTGREGEAFTAGGERVGVRWAVVDAFDDLVPSHEETGAGDLVENPAFAQELQPRDRERAASARQIEEIAKDLRPGALGESYYATDGAPIVGEDRIVESGNGRTLAVRRAYRTGRAEAYRKWVEEHAADFGLTREQARGMNAPMLVRVRTTPTENRAELAKQMNVPTVARMSAAETGRADADRLTPALLSRFQPSDDGLALLAARNRDFVAGFLETVPETERGELLDEDGQLSKAGITRIQNALLGKAYGRAPVLERITESTDDNTKLVSTALLNAAPAMAGLKGQIEAGNVRRDVDPTDAIVEAVQKLSWLRETSGTVESYLQQTGLFGDEMTPAGREILEAFDKFKRSGKKLTTFLTELVEGATLEGDARQQGLFAEGPTARLEDIVSAARRHALDGGQGDLFSGGEGVPAPGGDGAGTRGVPDGGPPGPVDRGRRSARPGATEPTVADARHVLLVQRWTTQLSERWKDSPEIRVVPSEAELPEGIRSRAEEFGATGTIEGLYTGPAEDVVYVVAPMVKSKADAERIVLHEVMGHAGLRRVLGRERFGATMRQIADSLPKDVEAKAREYGLDLEDADQRLEAAEEVLAEWASRPEAPPRAITRAMVAIRGWLRQLFPNIKWTPEDVRGLLARARRRVEEGGWERGAGEARLSRGEDQPDPRPPEDAAIRSAHERFNATADREFEKTLAWHQETVKAGTSAGAFVGERETLPQAFSLAGALRYVSRAWPDAFGSDAAARRALKAAADAGELSPAGAGSFNVQYDAGRRVSAENGNLGTRPIMFDRWSRDSVDRWLARRAKDVGATPRFSRAQESTPEFRRWFGDSKVVDEAGRPKVMYHGTPSPGFAEFNPALQDPGALWGPGFYFTSDPDVAGGTVEPYGKYRFFDTEEDAKTYLASRPDGWKFPPFKKDTPDGKDGIKQKWAIVEDDGIKIAHKGYAQNVSVTDQEEKLARAEAIRNSWQWANLRDKGGLTPWEWQHANAIISDYLIMRGYGLDALRSQPYNFPVDAVLAEAGFMDTGGVMPAYLRIENPFDVDEKIGVKAGMELLEKWAKRMDARGAETLAARLRGAKEEISGDIWVADGPTRGMVLDRGRMALSGYSSSAGKALREFLESEGYDGIRHTGGTRVGWKEHEVFIAFRPEQIKSATGNSGTFDPVNPDIRYSRRQEPQKTLVALHNTTPEGIRAMARLGGVPVPSLAITKADLSFDKYGPITLVGDRALVDPKADRRNKVFEADAWSPRQPMPTRELRPRALRAFEVRVNELLGNPTDREDQFRADAFSDPKGEGGYDDFIGRLTSDSRYAFPAKRAFLKTLGEDVPVPRHEDGSTKSLTMRKALDDALRGREAEYRAWLEEELAPAFGPEYLAKGRRKLPYTIDNLVDVMTRKGIRAKENTMFESLAKQRAASARTIPSVEGMHRIEERLVGAWDMEQAKEALNGEFFAFVDGLGQNRFFTGQFAKLDEASGAIGSVLKSGRTSRDGLAVALTSRGFPRPSDEVLDAGLEVARGLSSAPTEYFEAKPQRAVKLAEFKGAVVPDGTPQDVKDILAGAGLDVRTYRDEQGERGRVVSEMTEERGLRFSRTPSAAEERVYQRLKENARRKAQEAREAAQRVLDEVADPGDILEARRDETLPPHSRQLQDKLVPAGRKEDVEPLLKPVEALYQKAVRRHYAVEKTSERVGADKGPAHLDPGVVAELSAGHAARAEQMIEGKGGFRLTKDGGIEWTGNRSLADILKPLGKGRLNELRRYLVARRVVELHARKARTPEGDMFPDVAEDRSILSGISEAAARSEVAGAPADVKQAAEEITALLDDALQYWAEAGGLSPEAVRVIREMNRAYVPFYRIFEGHDPAAKAGRLVLPAERGKALQAEQAVKRLVGSSRDILDPLVSTVDHIQRMIRAADLNRVGKTLVEAAAKNPDAAVGLVERVTPQRDPAATKEGDAVQKVAESYGVEVTDEAAEAIDALSDRKLWFDNDRIRVWRDGKLEEYRVERSLAESLRALGPQDADVFQKLFTFPSKLLRGGVTKNPIFALHNFLRDTGDAAVQSRNGFIPFIDSTIGLAEAIRNGDLRKEWLAAGGGYATLAAGGVKGAESALKSIAPRTKAGTVIKTLRHPLEALSLLNRPFEEAARLGEYRRAKMAGKSATEAALDAARVTTNFTVHGSSAFLWGLFKASAFSNPALQGTDKAFRTVLEAPRGQKQTPALAGKAAVNVLFKGLLYVGGLSVLFGLLGDDDDEIKELRRTKAGAAWWFARVPGSEVIVRIPKPFLWGQLFGTGVEAMLDRMRDENPVAFKEWRTQVLEMITDGAVPIPTPVKVGFELATNKSLFSKRPIVPRGLEGVEGRYQYGPRTSETAKAAGRLTGLSPAKLEYATGQIGGTLGREALRVGDTLLGKGGDVEKPASRLGDLPLVGRAFASTPATSSDSIETFYDELKDVRAAVDTARHLKKTDPEEWERRRPELRRKILLSRRYESVADQIGDIRKRIVKLEKRADLNADEKRTRIDGLIRRQTEIARRHVDRRLLEENPR